MSDVLFPEGAEAIARRLAAARARRYLTASDAARALGVKIPTYLGHENGSREFSRSAPRYTRFFNVSLDWLLRGKGPMEAPRPVVAVMGRVGAGAVVTFEDSAAEIDAGEWAQLPREGDALALIVSGDSMRPRFYPGEIILYESGATLPERIIGQYAVVETDDGRTLIKVIRPALAIGGLPRFRLESHNADPEESVSIISAHRWIGVLAPRDERAAPVVATVARHRRR
jgi:phage repressor protein C with HTH and peptisase S24 domain